MTFSAEWRSLRHVLRTRDATRQWSLATYDPDEAIALYDQLPEFADMRLREITGMLHPFISVTDRHGRLIARLTCCLGSAPPPDTQDRVIRDLMADVFDFLYESRVLIVAGKLVVAYPLARRAFESLSLLHLCALDAKWAEMWHAGKRIPNAMIRSALAGHPLGESEAELRELYGFFSAASHPNRELVPQRLLGEGNEFVLGMVGVPDLILLLDYCRKNVELWHWFVATLSYRYKGVLTRRDRTYLQEYMSTYEEAERFMKWLRENQVSLQAEEQRSEDRGGS